MKLKLSLLMATLMMGALAAPASAASAVRLVVAFPAGGPADSMARVMASSLESALGSTVIVENKPGANGAIAINYVARGPSDGSVLFLSSAGAIAINPALYPNLAYDPVRDLQPVTLVTDMPQVFVVQPTEQASTAAEWLKQETQKPNPVTLASSGIGSMPHMVIELLKKQTKYDLLHVAYKGAAPAITDTMGGHVQAFIGDMSGLMPSITAGKLKPVGITSAQRVPTLPDVPTFVEQGMPDVLASNWYGIFVRSGTPADIVEKLNTSVRKSLESEALNTGFAAQGIAPTSSTVEQFQALIQQDSQKWAQVIKDGDIQPQ